MKQILNQKLSIVFTILITLSFAGCGAHIHKSTQKLGPSSTVSTAKSSSVHEGQGAYLAARGSGSKQLSDPFPMVKLAEGGRSSHDVSSQIDQAKSYFGEGAFDRALEQLNEAYRLRPDEDILMLIAVAYHRIFQKTKRPQDCGTALMGWQRYLSTCKRCSRRGAYLDRSILNANRLGETCGAWTRWESTPSAAKLMIDGVHLGMTPTDIWLSAGQHSYEIKRGAHSDQGTIKVEHGDQRTVASSLKLGEADAFSMTAQLRCAHPAASRLPPLKDCAGKLISGDLFTVNLTSSEDVFLYLLNESDTSIKLALPQGDQLIAARSERPVTLPTRDAFKLDDLAKRDVIWVVGSTQPISMFTAGEKSAPWKSEVKSLISQFSLQLTQDSQVVTSKSGIAVIGWTLRQTGVAQSPLDSLQEQLSLLVHTEAR